MAKKLKVCFVGAGYMAFQHAIAFSAHDEFEIVGVSGRTSNNVMKFLAKFGGESFSSIAKMYEGTRADVVVTSVNEASSLEVSLRCLDHDWICLFEKPAGQNLLQAEKILEVARKRNKTDVFVGLNRRSYNSTRKVVDELTHDSSPRVINVFDQQNREAALALGHPIDLVEDWMFANSVHLVDYLLLFGRGEVRDVKVLLPFDREKPTSVVASIFFSSGDIGLYQASWQGPGPWSVIVATDMKRYELAPLENLKIQKKGERSKGEWHTGREGPAGEEIKEGLYNQANELFLFASTGQTRLTGIDEATQSMRLVAEVYGV